MSSCSDELLLRVALELPNTSLDSQALEGFHPSMASNSVAELSTSALDGDEQSMGNTKRKKTENAGAYDDKPMENSHTGKQIENIAQNAGKISRKLSEKRGARGRQNSLRRAKDSTDALRQQSLNDHVRNATSSSTSGAREGRQFTVANVGNNGMIYLRFVHQFHLDAFCARSSY